MNRSTWENIIKYGAYSVEFDWFAIDKKEQLGVFSSVMNAPVPTKVMKSYDLYNELKTIIDQLKGSRTAIIVTTEQGRFSSWLKYSTKGLFAFDFQDVHRTIKRNEYDLISKSLEPILLEELNLRKEILEVIPKFNCDFEDGNISVLKI